jgi:ribosomal protein L22
MRYLRVSPQKARLVLELIKGRKVEEARNTLLFTKKRVAAHVGKERDCERRTAHEAHSPGAARAGFPLPAAHLAHRVDPGRTPRQ